MLILQKVEVPVLVSDKVSYRTKNITSAKESYFIIRKKSVHQKDVFIYLIEF